MHGRLSCISCRCVVLLPVCDSVGGLCVPHRALTASNAWWDWLLLAIPRQFSLRQKPQLCITSGQFCGDVGGIISAFVIMTPFSFYTYSVWGTAAASPPPTGIGDPALCGSQPLVTPVSLCGFRDYRGFAVILCLLVCILVKKGSLYLVLCVCFLSVVNTSASDCLERLVPEMIYYVLRGT